MINEFLQFLKKQKLAIQLAKEDMLFLLYPLRIFRPVLPLSRFFLIKSKQTPAQRVENYISAHHDSILSLYATPLALSYGIKPPFHPEEHLTETVEIKQSLSVSDYSLGKELLPELALNNANLDEDYLLEVLELNSDMRLYGAEFSELQSLASECGGNLDLQIDWQQTSSEKLYVKFHEETFCSVKLPEAVQQNLAKIFFYLLYRKACLVLDWSSVFYDAQSKVFWRDFSVIHNLSKNQQQYALQNVLSRQLPKNAEEQNIKRALDLLRFYCPQVDMATLSKRMGLKILSDFKTHDNEWSQKNTVHLQQLNADDGHNRIPPTNKNLYQRLKSKPMPKHLGKSSLYYLGPLILAAFLLYYLF